MTHPSMTAPVAPPAVQTGATYALLAILGIALVLRVWGITFGLPYDFTPDEVHEIIRALKLGAGEYTLDYGKGGLYLLLFVEYGFLFVSWWLTGRVEGPTDFALAYVQDPTAFYLAGRLTVAVMGVLTCLVVYAIGKRLYDWRVGLAAAFIAATAYYHGLWSHYINVDIGMTLALWASVLAYLEYEKGRRLRWLIGAGVLGGVAIAFKLPGALVVLPLILAIATPPERWSAPREIAKQAGIYLSAMLLTVAVLAPGLIINIGSLPRHFSNLLPSTEDDPSDAGFAAESDPSDDIYLVTVRGTDYFTILLNNHTVLLTLSALLGAVIGCWRRHRWDIIWCVVIAVFLLVMEVADRPGNERYLLPIVPALWLLSARAAVAIAGQRHYVTAAIVAVVVAVPLYQLIRQNYTWTQPDTRVLAKNWIEANVPSGAKILMDGMDYRFIQSPPLNPDEDTVARRVSRADEEGNELSRGISGQTLELYAEAMARVTGPKYELHSTVWGLDVKDLSYYPQACFDYIVTSSQIIRRYDSPAVAETLPKSAEFYRQLPTDPRYEVVYSIEPLPWKIQGPSITVYEVASTCAE